MSKKSTTFYCFSPAVMITTFVIETIGVIYVLWRYKMNEISRLVVLILTFLATFQLAEYMVCEGSGPGWLTWSRIGFVAITLLPPLGLHLAYALAGAKKRLLLWPAYLAAAAFVGFFVFVNVSLSGHVCAGNYVIFHVAPGSGWLYGLYYYGLLLAGTTVSGHFRQQAKNKKVRRALGGLIFGYLAFIIPTATVSLLKPETQNAIPSVMCGFAVLLALILVFVVVPATVRRK